MSATDLLTGSTFTIGERKVAWSGDYLTDLAHANYDVSPDGSQFLMLKRAGDEAQTIVVHNWERELLARMAAKASP